MIELLNDAAYRHMLLNHIPVIGLGMALLVLLSGIALRQTAMLCLGLALIAITAGSSLPVAVFGDDAYPAMFDELNGDGRAWLDYHVHLAETWLPVLYVNAACAVLALILSVLRRPLLFPAALLVAVVTVAGIGTAGWIAKAGGRIKHPEFRLDDPPVIKSSRRLQ